MKRLFSALALGLAMLFAAPAVMAGGQDTPVPLDYPIKFPWGSIQGIWQVETGEVNSLFSFEVQSDCQNRQILKILEIDANSGRVVSEGIGYLNDHTNQVYAAMQGTNGNSFILYVGAYKDTHTFPPRRFVALRIASFTDSVHETVFRVQKLQDDAIDPGGDTPSDICSKYELNFRKHTVLPTRSR